MSLLVSSCVLLSVLEARSSSAEYRSAELQKTATTNADCAGCEVRCLNPQGSGSHVAGRCRVAR